MVLDGTYVEDSLVGEHEPVWLQELVACDQHTVQHGFVEQELAHPLRDYDVYLILRTRQFLDVLHLALHDLDRVLLVVQSDNLLGLGSDV